MNTGFAASVTTGDPGTLAARAAASLPRLDGANLGILYVTEPAHAFLPELLEALAMRTGVGAWVGGVGLGICGLGAEAYDEAAAAIMLAALPEDSFRIFAATADPGADLPRRHGGWIERMQPSLALVHGDPRCPDLPRAAIDAGSASGAFLVGGLVSHRCAAPLVARTKGGDSGLGKAGLAGVMLAPGVSVATALTQGCSPIGPVRRIDEARDNIIMAIDGRPAFSVFVDDIGPELAQDLRHAGGVIFAGLPVRGSDRGDYLVRNLMAVDPGRGWVVLGDEVAAGDPILFCRRDPQSARRDMVRMIEGLAGRLAGPPKAGIYVSCIARGGNLFGEEGVETGLIRETFGDIPLIGFFANGEISRDRLYGHTGVLTLFTDGRMLRLFVGIGFPPEVKLRLSLLAAGLPGARWVDPANYHLTLRFIGEIDEGVAADVDAALARLRARRFSLQLAGTGVFGNGKPRQVWVGVAPNPDLVALHGKVEQALVRAGLAPEPRKFAPHVTLARLHNPAIEPLRLYLAAHAQFCAEPLAVAGFSLIASFQTKAGSVYEDQADYKLLP